MNTFDRLSDVLSSRLITRIAYVPATSLPEYVGVTYPNVAESQDKWRISKLTYSGTDVVAINFAEGSNEFAYVWDDRATYTYS